MTIFEEHCYEICQQFPAAPNASHNAIVSRFLPFVQQFINIGQINGKPMTLSIGFVDDASYNAWASTVGDVDLIGMNHGLSSTLRSAFRAVLSDMRVSPKVGTAWASDSLVQRFQGRFQECGDNPSLWTSPPLRDAKRDLRACALAEGAELYVLFHEFAHIFNGHTSYINSFGRRQPIFEIRKDPLEGPSSIFAQTLEFDADASAVQNLLSAVLRPDVDDTTLPSKWRLVRPGLFGGLNECLEVVSQIVRMNHLFFARLSELGRDADEWDHPPEVVRSVYSARQIAHVLNLRVGLDYHDVYTKVLMSEETISDAFYRSVGVVPEQYNRDDLEEKVDHYVGLYTNAWVKLRPVLDTMKRGGVLAPAKLS